MSKSNLIEIDISPSRTHLNIPSISSFLSITFFVELTMTIKLPTGFVTSKRSVPRKLSLLGFLRIRGLLLIPFAIKLRLLYFLAIDSCSQFGPILFWFVYLTLSSIQFYVKYILTNLIFLCQQEAL